MNDGAEAKLREWFEREKANGLVDLKIALNPDSTDLDRESVCREINEMIAAPDIPMTKAELRAALGE